MVKKTEALDSERIKKLFDQFPEKDIDIIGSSNDKIAQQEEDDRYAKKKREETKRSILHTVFIIGIWVAFGLAVIFILVRVCHLILPISIRWLTIEDVAALDKSLFSIALGAFLGKYINNIFDDK